MTALAIDDYSTGTETTWWHAETKHISEKTEIYYIKILWLLSKKFPSMLWAILYDIVMNNCEKI